MNKETITKIQVNEAGELLLLIEGNGKPTYQYVYREAAGVYWDNELHAFKSTPMKSWSCVQWFSQIVDVAKAVNVELCLSKSAQWQGVPLEEQHEIVKTYAR